MTENIKSDKEKEAEKYSGQISYFFTQLSSIVPPVIETSTNPLNKRRSQTSTLINNANQLQAKKKNKKAALDEFKYKITQTFTDVEELFKSDLSLNWTTIFHYRMIIKKDLLTKEQVNNYKEVVQIFITLVKKVEDAYPFFELCYSFVDYLDSHYVDPDNSLVGKPFRLSFFSKYYSEFLGDNSIQSEEIKKRSAHKSISITQNVIKMNTNNTLQTIGGEDGTVIFNSVSQSVIDDQKFVQLYFDPLELSKKKINITSLFHLPSEVIENNFSTRFLILKMVDDPIENWLQNTLSYIVQKTHFFLEEKGINQSVIDTLKTLCVVPFHISHLAHLHDLLRLHFVVNDLKLNPPLSFYQSLDHQIQERFTSFLSNTAYDNNNNNNNNSNNNINNNNSSSKVINYHLEDCFEVTKEESINQIQKYHYSDIARDTFSCYLGNCEYVLDHLREEQQSHLDGSTKQKLTSWWLSKIYQSVMEYLERLGYLSSAIPDDYIANPPSNIQDIRSNLKIITEVLNTKEDIHGIQSFLQQLTNEIYVKVDEFIMNAYYSISPYVFVPPEVNSPKSISELKDSINHLIIYDDLADELKENIMSVMKDLDYLLEMKDMDEITVNNNTNNGLILSKVVPIKGLILGSFYRKENVLKTILELFDNSTVVNVIVPKDLLSPPPSLSSDSSNGSVNSAPQKIPPRTHPRHQSHHPGSSNSIITSNNNNNNNNSNGNNSIVSQEEDVEEKIQFIRSMYNDKIKQAANSFDWDATIRLATLAKQKETEFLYNNHVPSPIDRSKFQRLRRATNSLFTPST